MILERELVVIHFLHFGGAGLTHALRGLRRQRNIVRAGTSAIVRAAKEFHLIRDDLGYMALRSVLRLSLIHI